ncbi:hypothetical protein Kpol_507p4 [Vanderwaltozyma polyspora DSM 70294]|uniref:PCI domain-containing protein n=1 Tax=Vanderwaltozyma polyspora (strain ATCC 22028 / DSM 70294 / BCRC 21397 / CBS 2163 / NBRC 10782 / NRRL Y-8283 / UCD 57-17) TaxID=436907 RepID=A7TPF6_VANPO|nr:uncharacterized protein Kpol_507p4 [Vanderwaltozyma polyspora DSM 70294]EDO15842.1 hypothetical protein Kpol_507p4 [Vanderwaltozyma polyspora DSM 70294]
MVSLADLVKSLNIAFSNKDYESCEKLLAPVKIELIKSNLLIPDLTNTNEVYVNDLNIAKKILEIGALVSIYTLKFENFQNYFSQIRVFYFCSNPKLNESEYKSKLISLYLLILLSHGDTSEFHSELEYLSKHITNLEDDSLLSYPIKVEKWLMEGAYQKSWELLEAGSKVPEFDVFTETLKIAIREEIARNAELSYEELSLTNIKALLFLESEKKAEAFAIERGWKIVKGNVIFPGEEPEVDKELKELEKAEKQESTLIEKTLNYAINLESIV